MIFINNCYLLTLVLHSVDLIHRGGLPATASRWTRWTCVQRDDCQGRKRPCGRTQEVPMKRRFALPVLAAVGLAALTGSPVSTAAESLPLPHYPTLAANPDLVLAGPYEPIVTGVANWGTG